MKLFLLIIGTLVLLPCLAKDFSWTPHNSFDLPTKDLSLNGKSKVCGYISNYTDSIGLNTIIILNQKRIELNDTGYFEIILSAQRSNNFKITSTGKETIQIDSIDLLPNCVHNGTFVLFPENQGVEIQGGSMFTYKPAIYLYPEEAIDVRVRLYPLGKIDFSYPQYDNGWIVKANPNGKLEQDGKFYDYLFWDGPLDVSYNEEKFSTGWIVSKDSLLPFFESKLTKMGLNSTEKNDFITFWVPKLKKNDQTLIHFLLNEDYDEIAHLNVYPKVDNSLRMLMLYFNAESWKNQPTPQQFPKFERDGFSLVEWGGAEAIVTKPLELSVPIPMMGNEVDKPVIYLYPEKTSQFELEFDFKGTLEFTYPEYRGIWKGTMHPNGQIEIDNKNYDYLFWEGTKPDLASNVNLTEGSIVAKNQLTTFLNKSLLDLGLNESEIQDFMCYWVPRMTKNEQNFIHFICQDDYNDKIAALNMVPEPDQMIRLFMVWGKASNQSNTALTKQTFRPIKRTGFTLVEWGGSEIDEFDKETP